MKRLLLLAGALSLAAPAAAQQRVDPARLMEDLRWLAADERQGRAPETPGGREARAYVEKRFADLDLEPFGNSYVHPFTFPSPADSTTRVGANVVGWVRGTAEPDSFIVVTAHFDHVGVRDGVVYNGADDNASGTAGLMAAAAWFRAHPPRHSVVFVALDAEERGLQGARAFVAAPPVPLERLILNVNMDMVGRNAKGELFAAGTHHTPRLRAPLERAAAGSRVTLRFGHDTPQPTPSDDWTSQSDHFVFHQAGIPFVYFGVEDHPDYHRPTDDVERIEPGFFAGAVELVIRALEALDAAL